MCNNCTHKDVCYIHRATGGVNNCEHRREDRKGKWIGKRLDNFRMYQVTCSECGWVGIENYDSYNDPSTFDFCPNCGADTRGAEDG